MRYVYMPGLIADKDHAPLAYEPAIFGDERLVLLADGKIVIMNEREPASAAGKGP
jgi:hypothetical protein